MLRRLNGIIVEVLEDSVLIQTGDFTFQAVPSFRVLKEFSPDERFNYEAILEINEYGTALFLFRDTIERETFDTLRKVSKLGPKTCGKIIKSVDSEVLRNIIAGGDIDKLSKVPGVGKKTAERIVTELKGEFENLDIHQREDFSADAVEAMLALGFDKYSVLKALKGIKTENLPTEEIIKLLLTKVKR